MTSLLIIVASALLAPADLVPVCVDTSFRDEIVDGYMPAQTPEDAYCEARCGQRVPINVPPGKWCTSAGGTGERNPTTGRIDCTCLWECYDARIYA